SGGQLLTRLQAGEIPRSLGLVVDLAQAAGQLGGGAQRGHAVTLDQPGDRGMIDPGLQRQLTLAHLLFPELASEPAVEGPRRLERHAVQSVRPVPTEMALRWCVRATEESQSDHGRPMAQRYRCSGGSWPPAGDA